jgi:hypothetical protein
VHEDIENPGPLGMASLDTDGSPSWSISAGAALPMNLEPSQMCVIRAGSNPIRRAQVASAAPLDQFIVQHPEYFFESSPEHAHIQPDNVEIRVAEGHLKTFRCEGVLCLVLNA